MFNHEHGLQQRIRAVSMDPSGLITVFVVEDSPAIREALMQRIEDDPRFTICGYADTVADARVQLGKLLPDVVTLDLHLKQGTGYDILAHLGQTARRADIKIMVLTNYASAAHRRHAMALGANGFFDKSMQFDDMLEALRIWANEKHQQPPSPPPQ